MKVIDLFAGCGGFSTGFMQAGFHISKAVEFDISIANTYQLNHKQVTLLDNTITKESFYSKIGNPPLRNYRVPLISNPFHIASFDFAFYESLWRSINIP